MNNNLIAVVLSGLLVVPAGSAVAAEVKYSQEYQVCMDRSDGVTPVMIDCIGTENNRWDAKLNANYKKLMAAFEGEKKEKFKDAQRQWLKFRDANCGFIFGRDDGSQQRIEANLCHLRMTAERSLELADFITSFAP